MTASEVNLLRSMVVSLFALNLLRSTWHASEVNLLRSMVVSLFAFDMNLRSMVVSRLHDAYFVLWWYHYSRLHDCERSELTSFYGSITIRVYMMTASEVNLLRSMVVSLFAFTWLRAKWTYFVLWWVSLFAFTWLRAKWTYFVLWWYHYSRLHDCERSELTSFYGSITIRVYMTASEVNLLRSMVVSLFAFTWLRAKWTYFVLW